MLLVITGHATKEEIEKMAEDFNGYIKVVVDIEKGILTGGGKRHVEGEQKLLESGSKQKNLWGGGLDLESSEIDYNSMINIRPSQNNLSRDIMSEEIRKEFDEIIKKLLL
ncbi:MAG: DUF5674 family protein [bacterium]|nr:DUF5674 family protein [bacterium]